MINNSGYALSLIEINKKNINLCSKICNVFLFYLYDYHPILSIFKSTKYTNYSLSQRIWCCYLYILSVCFFNSIKFIDRKKRQ